MEEIHMQPDFLRARCPFCLEYSDIGPDVGGGEVCEHFVDFDGREFIFSKDGE